MEEKRKTLPWCWWTIGGLMLFVAYPLSVWPVSYLAAHNMIRGEVLIGYVPLLFAWEWLVPGNELPEVLAGVDFHYSFYFDHGRLRRTLIQ